MKNTSISFSKYNIGQHDLIPARVSHEQTVTLAYFSYNTLFYIFPLSTKVQTENKQMFGTYT